MATKLFLIPNALSNENFSPLPFSLKEAVKHVRHFCVEEEKSARKLLKYLIPDVPVVSHQIFPLNEHTSRQGIEECLNLLKNNDVGLISEAGCPCVADPGSDLVRLAHKNQVEIIPLVGPSSILLALMASGLNGQNFAFVGYLPKDREARINKLRDLEKRSFAEKQTQIFMETPYRNQNILDDILSACHPETFLSIAVDLTGPAQSIKTLTVKDWKIKKPLLPKEPALFLILKETSK